MKSGFTLVEILIAAALAGILSAVLFTALNQVNRSVRISDDVVGMFDRMMLARRQLERDLSGVCAPVSRPLTKHDEKPEAKQPEQKQEQKKEKPKPVERLFYSKNKGPILDRLTFITNNPLDVYWSDRAGSARPRIARVQYYLEQEPKTEKNPSHALYRQEAYTLEYDPFKKDGAKSVRSYKLISGIKELKMTYGQAVETQDAKKNEPKKEIREVTEWDLQGEKAQDGKAQIQPTPEWVKIELTLWNDTKKRSRSFTFYVDVPFRVAKEEKKKQQEQQAPQQAAQPKAGASSDKAPKNPLAQNIEAVTDVTITASGDVSIVDNLIKKNRNVGAKST